MAIKAKPNAVKQRPANTARFHDVFRATLGTDRRLPFPPALRRQLAEAGVTAFVLCPWFGSRLRLVPAEGWQRFVQRLGKAGLPRDTVERALDFIVQPAREVSLSAGGVLDLPKDVYDQFSEQRGSTVRLLRKPGYIDIIKEQNFEAEKEAFLEDEEAQEKIAELFPAEDIVGLLGSGTEDREARPGALSLSKRIAFMAEHIFLDGHLTERNADWRVVEYFLWKNSWVTYAEGYLILPDWRLRRIEDPRTLLRQRTNKTAQNLGKNGVVVRFEANRKRGADKWKIREHNLITNIPDAQKQYREAELLFTQNDYQGAKSALLKALTVYPNHLESNILLANCYQKLGFEGVSADEAAVIRASWHYLSEKSDAFKSLGDVVSPERLALLQSSLPLVVGSPILTQLQASAQLLGKYVLDNACTQDDRILAEVGTLLKTIAGATDSSLKQQKVREFCELPCVRHVISRAKDGERLILRLCYPELDEAGSFSRLRTMSRLAYKSLRAFQSYLRKTLEGIRKDIPREGLRRLSGIPEEVQERIKRVSEIEAQLCQQLSDEPSQGKLKEHVLKETGWSLAEVEHVLYCRGLSIEHRDEFPTSEKDFRFQDETVEPNEQDR